LVMTCAASHAGPSTSEVESAGAPVIFAWVMVTID
jgi:hypothetical protein